MKKLLFLALLPLSVFSSAQKNTYTTSEIDSILESSAKHYIGKPFPVFNAVNGKHKINNDSLKGKVVLINFWFETCHPCMAEMPALNELAVKLKDNQEFELISFTWENMQTVQRIKDEYHLQFKVLSISREECLRLNRNGYPTTFILDRNGIIRYCISGGSTDPEEARKFVMNRLLKKIEQEF